MAVLWCICLICIVMTFGFKRLLLIHFNNKKRAHAKIKRLIIFIRYAILSPQNSLNERYRLLSRQREDAKDLKENLDRRERVVSGILSKYLSDSQLQDYRHFVQAKTSLLVEQKDLEEQIKFLEEQLERLETSIPPEVTFGPTRFYE